MIGEVPVDIEPSTGALNGIDQTIAVLIQLLEMVVHEIRRLRIRRPGAPAMALARIVALGLVQDPVIQEIRFRLHGRSWSDFLRRACVSPRPARVDISRFLALPSVGNVGGCRARRGGRLGFREGATPERLVLSRRGRLAILPSFWNRSKREMSGQQADGHDDLQKWSRDYSGKPHSLSSVAGAVGP